jgi:hypothetical protein
MRRSYLFLYLSTSLLLTVYTVGNTVYINGFKFTLDTVPYRMRGRAFFFLLAYLINIMRAKALKKVEHKRFRS